MTKEVFCEFYPIFQYCVKQEVNGQYVMNASTRLVNFCGGYVLELHPSCLMWGKEIALMEALCDKFCLSMEITLYDGRISIY